MIFLCNRVICFRFNLLIFRGVDGEGCSQGNLWGWFHWAMVQQKHICHKMHSNEIFSRHDSFQHMTAFLPYFGDESRFFGFTIEQNMGIWRYQERLLWEASWSPPWINSCMAPTLTTFTFPYILAHGQHSKCSLSPKSGECVGCLGKINMKDTYQTLNAWCIYIYNLQNVDKYISFAFPKNFPNCCYIYNSYMEYLQKLPLLPEGDFPTFGPYRRTVGDIAWRTVSTWSPEPWPIPSPQWVFRDKLMGFTTKKQHWIPMKWCLKFKGDFCSLFFTKA